MSKYHTGMQGLRHQEGKEMPEPNYKMIADMMIAKVVQRCIVEGCRYSEASPDECIWCAWPKLDRPSGLENLMREVFSGH